MLPRLFFLAVLLFVPLARAEELTPPSYPPPTQMRQAFRKLLDRPAVPLNLKVVDTKTANGLVTEHFSFASEKRSDGQEERVPALLVRPEKVQGRLPAVIVLDR